MMLAAGSLSRISDRTARLWQSKALLGVLVAVGAALRLRQYASNPAFFAEEASLTLNIVHRSWAQLLQPLDYNQGAPPLFLWLARLLMVTAGHADFVLRLVPALASVAALPLFAASARALVGARSAPVALGLLALADPLMVYATVFKQYSSDVAVSAALLYLASRQRPLLLIAGGVIAMWLSHPAPIMLTGLGAMILFQAVRERRVSARIVAAGFGVWSMSAVCLYAAHSRHVAANEVFKRFWSFAYAPFPPLAPEHWRWYAHSVGDLLRQTGLPVWPAGLLLLAALIALIVARRHALLLLLVTPLLVAYVLSAARIYPFADRLIFFLVPVVALLVSVGAMQPVEMLLRRSLRAPLAARMAPAALVVAQAAVVGWLFAANVPQSIQRWRSPYEKSHMRELATRLRQLRAAGDVVYANSRAWAPYEYYSLDDAQAPPCVSGGTRKFFRELDQQPSQRVWLVFLTGSEKTESQRVTMLAEMDARAKCEQHWQRNETWLFLYRTWGKEPVPADQSHR